MVRLISILTLLFASSTYLAGQGTWFKIVPNQGQLNAVSFILGDTITSFGSDHKNITGSATKVFVSRGLSNGEYIDTDTLDFAQVIKTNNLRFVVLKANQVVYDSMLNHFEVAATANDTFKERRKVRNVVLNYPKKSRVSRNHNFDTFENSIYSYKKIGANYYGVQLAVHKDIVGKSVFSEFYLAKYQRDTLMKIKSNLFGYSVPQTFHRHIMNNVIGDRLSSKNLFLHESETWNNSNNKQDHIIKLDTSGTVVWDCKINTNDSTNTIFSQIEQAPNGNILVFWNDYQYGANQPQNSSSLWQSNSRGSINFIEINYSSGLVVSRKSFRNLIDQHIENWGGEYTRFTKNHHSNILTGICKAKDGILVIGHIIGVNKALDENPDTTVNVINKNRPFILKTDFKGVAKWYKEVEILKTDTNSEGMTTYHAILMPDSGILISGEHEFKNQSPQACLLKLDKYGCFTKGCHLTSLPKIEPKKVTVYPNPSAGMVHFEGMKSENVNIKVLNTTGICVFETPLESNNKVNLEWLSEGLYILNLTFESNGKNETHKILIKH